MLFVGLALVPLAASVAAVAPGWLPVGDDATIVMRGRDLLSGDTPLLGMPSAVGQQTGRTVHHPGPLELWWVGLWVRGLGSAQAALIAASLAWTAATAAALVFARRIGGVPLLALGAFVTALLTWSLRGEVPVTPFNAHVMVMSMLAFLVAMLAWHAQVRGAGLAAIVLGSWSAQAHLTAVGPVVTVAVVVVAAVLFRRWRSDDPPDAPPWRSIGVAVAVLVLCWIGPIADVVTDDGGNVRAVLDARADLASEAIGPDRALDIVVNAVSFPPAWATAGAHPSEFVRSPGVWSWSSAAAVVAVGAAGSIRRRRSHPTLALAMVCTTAATTVGAVLAARFPGEFLSLLALHNHLWLWPFAALLWAVAAVVVSLEVADRASVTGDRAARVVRPAFVVAVVLLLAVGVASLGAPHRNLALAQPDYVRAIGDGAIDRLDPDATYRVRISGGFEEFFVEVGLLSYLEGAGLDVVGPRTHRDAFGDGRTTPSGRVAGELVVRVGWEEDVDQAAGTRLGIHVPRDDLLAERAAREDRVVALLRSGEYPLPLFGMSDTGDTEVRRWLREDLAGLQLAGLVPEGLARAPETEAYIELRREPILFASVHLVPAAVA